MSNKTVFALWADDGYYYPATIGESDGDQTQVFFLDGSEAFVESNQIIELDEAYKTMKFEGDWEKQGGFYACDVDIAHASDKSAVVVYRDDSVSECADLVQLRALPSRKTKVTSSSQSVPVKKGSRPRSAPSEPVPGKYWFVIGGALLALFGAVFLINNLIVSASLGALPETANGWDMAFRVGIIVLPALWLISGVLHLLLGLYGRRWLYTVTGQVASRINGISIFLFGGFIAGGQMLIAPYFDNLAFASVEVVMWTFLVLLIAITQIPFIGFSVNHRAWEMQTHGQNRFSTSFHVVRIVTRLLIIIAILPIAHSAIRDAESLRGLPPLAYAYLGMCMMEIFTLEGVGYDYEYRVSVFRLLKRRVVQAVTLVVLITAAVLVYGPIITWLCKAPLAYQIVALIIFLIISNAKGGVSGGSPASSNSSSGPVRDAHTVTCSTCGATIMAGGTCTNCANHPNIFG